MIDRCVISVVKRLMFCIFKVIKLYAWEESFMKKILGIREEELNYLTRGSYLQSGFSFVFTCAPFLVSLTSHFNQLFTL